MKRTLLLILSILICCSVYAQNEDLMLFKLPDKKHTKKIRSGARISLYHQSFTPDSSKTFMTIEGNLNFATADSVNMMVKMISNTYELDSVLKKRTILSRGGFPLKAFKSESYPLSDINMILYQNKSSQVFTKIGTYLLVASIVTAAVAAPLASINYKDGTFNMDTYKSMVIAGGAGIVVSIPILIFSQQRYVNLKQGKTKRRRKVYTYVRHE